MRAASLGTKVNQHSRENGEGKNPKEPVHRAAAYNANDRLLLAALEKCDDNDQSPQAKQ